MPKGTFGCWRCGSRDTVATVQVWLRDYTDETYANGSRKQVSIDSTQRVFCALCAPGAYDEAATALTRVVTGYFGCAYCGSRSESRIQVWVRDYDQHNRDERGNRKQVTSRSDAGSFCEECSLMAYEAACRPVEGPRGEGQRHTAGGLSAARAQRNANRLKEKQVTPGSTASKNPKNPKNPKKPRKPTPKAVENARRKAMRQNMTKPQRAPKRFP